MEIVKRPTYTYDIVGLTEDEAHVLRRIIFYVGGTYAGSLINKLREQLENVGVGPYRDGVIAIADSETLVLNKKN